MTDTTTMTFEALHLAPALLAGLADLGHMNPTDVQQAAIPAALDGRDLMVSARTGSGKTAAFVLPALTRVLEARQSQSAAPAFVPERAPEGRPPRDAHQGPHGHRGGGFREGRPQRRDFGPPTGPCVLVLVPTRELALQVARATAEHGRHIRGLRVATVVGGVPYGAQLKALRGPLDVLIATPGRLMDHMASGKAVLANVRMLVLDEADRMLDMGFIDDIRHIADHLPGERQTLMTSATFGGNVGQLARTLLRDPQRIDVASHTETHADIEQRLHWADNAAHKTALLDHLLTERDIDQAVVFTSTQRDADWLAERLSQMGHQVAALHGGMPQGRRNRVLQGLRMRALRVLVATDVAARGIDVPSISHVINYGLPMKPEDYVHRIGRTGRAGRTGLAVTLAERRDGPMLHRIQRFTTQAIPPAVIAGLEPQVRPEPMHRPGGPGRPGGKSFGGRGRPGGGGGRPAPGRPGGRFGGPRPR